MLLSTKNLFDPIMYMMKQMDIKRYGSGITDGNPKPNTCLEAVQKLKLVKEKGRLMQVVGEFFVITLFYEKGRLIKVVGVCNSGYELTLDLIYAGPFLDEVIPTEKGLIGTIDPTPDQPDEPIPPDETFEDLPAGEELHDPITDPFTFLDEPVPYDPDQEYDPYAE